VAGCFCFFRSAGQAGVPAGVDPCGQLWSGFDSAVSGAARLRTPEPEDREASGCVSSGSKRHSTFYIPVQG